ncbi:hypothetical protein [Anaeromyxobacter sp. PSR-1]|uniref:hypothetical protein n=1 Tax=unclassified Anaeromyxobacter TaxID=2620896 RepID=UPI0005E52BFA|nr:hypothetical protein [Anaeromyxobacter sp. PSR-1]GAO03797.1 hypothetical protein PSR1_02683 [Anaeromyxobacter sp. PSR-1]
MQLSLIPLGASAIAALLLWSGDASAREKFRPDGASRSDGVADRAERAAPAEPGVPAGREPLGADVQGEPPAEDRAGEQGQQNGVGHDNGGDHGSGVGQGNGGTQGTGGGWGAGGVGGVNVGGGGAGSGAGEGDSGGISVPELDPAAAGVISALVVGGGVLLARRRRR